jgi:tetratricopeptide (TPR) repeat protein
LTPAANDLEKSARRAGEREGMNMVDADEAWDAAQEGAELIAAGDPEAARRMLEALAQAQPNNEYAFFFLGAAHFELGNFDKALAAYVKTLELAPGYAGAMINAGHTLRMLGRYEQAIRMGREVLARDKHDPDALFLLGTAHYARGDNAASQGYLERLLETRPEPELVTEITGMLQVLRGDVAPADPDDDHDD